MACGPSPAAAEVVSGSSGDSAAASPARETAAGRDPAPDPYEVLVRLTRITRLARGRAEQDELLGRACLLVRRFGCWRRPGFASFDEWDEVARRIGATDRVILRDGALCRIPGCSRAADHVHHVVPRSACGPLEPWNELSLCAVHHLRGVHGGNIRITGKAPDGLAFTLGERDVAAARA